MARVLGIPEVFAGIKKCIFFDPFRKYKKMKRLSQLTPSNGLIGTGNPLEYKASLAAENECIE